MENVRPKVANASLSLAEENFLMWYGSDAASFSTVLLQISSFFCSFDIKSNVGGDEQHQLAVVVNCDPPTFSFPSFHLEWLYFFLVFLLPATITQMRCTQGQQNWFRRNGTRQLRTFFPRMQRSTVPHSFTHLHPCTARLVVLHPFQQGEQGMHDHE